ncbi:MAG: hypothetical protein ACK56I_15085, partial [bacterium]
LQVLQGGDQHRPGLLQQHLGFPRGLLGRLGRLIRLVQGVIRLCKGATHGRADLHALPLQGVGESTHRRHGAPRFPRHGFRHRREIPHRAGELAHRGLQTS